MTMSDLIMGGPEWEWVDDNNINLHLFQYDDENGKSYMGTVPIDLSTVEFKEVIR